MAVDYDVSKFGLIYAGAQKNLGIAGLTIVIIREDLLNEAESLSSMMDYQILVEADFLVNIFESGMTHEAAEKVYENIFRTKTGKQLLKDLFL